MESKPRRLWRILRWILIPVLLLAVLIALAPWILSTDAVREGIVEGINKAIPGRVSAKKMKFRWAAGQTLENVELRDPSGEVVLRVERVLLEASLIRMLFGKLDFGTIRVHGLQADLERDENGELNLERALVDRSAEPEGTAPEGEERGADELPPGLRLRLEVVEGRVNYREPGMDEPLLVEPLDATFFVTGSGDPWTAEVRAQEKNRGISVALDASLQGVTEPRVRGRVEAAFAETARELRGLLGESVVVKFDAGRTEIDVEANSERLALNGRFQRDPVLSLAEPLTLRWAPDPAPFYPDAELPSEVRLDLVVNELRVPLDRIEELTVDGSCTLSDGVARIPVAGEVQEIAWRDWVIRAKAAPLGTEVQAMLEGKLRSGGDSGTVALDARATDLLDRERTRIDGVFRVRDFPIDALDRILSGVTGKPGLLTDLLGDRLEVDAKTTTGDLGNVQVTLDARSPRLRVVAPVTLDLESSRLAASDVTARLTLAEGFLSGAPIQGDLPVHLRVNALDLPLRGLDLASGRVDATLSVDSIRVAGETGSISATIAKEAGQRTLGGRSDLKLGRGVGTATFRLDLPESEEGALGGMVDARFENLPLSVAESLLDLDGELIEACGPVLSGSLKATGQDGKTTFESDWSANRFTSLLSGTMDAERRVDVEGKTTITVTPKLASRFGVELTEPVRLRAQPTDLSFSLPFDRTTLRGKVVVSTEMVTMTRFALKGVKLENEFGTLGLRTVLDCEADLLDADLRRFLGESSSVLIQGHHHWIGEETAASAQLLGDKFTLNAEAKRNEDGSVAVSGKGGMGKPLGEGSPYDFQATIGSSGEVTGSGSFQEFPLAVIDARLAGLFGDRARLQADFGAEDARVSVGTERLQLDAEALLKGDRVVLRKPATARWSLTPRAWSTLVGDETSGFRLGAPATVLCEIHSFEYDPAQPSSCTLQASAGIEELALAHRESGARAVFRPLTLSIVQQGLAEPVSISVQGRLSDPRRQGRIRGSLELHAWDAKTKALRIDPQALSFDSRFELEDVAVAPLDGALGLEQRGLAVLGDYVSLESRSRMRGGKGTVDLKVTSGNAKADVALLVDRKLARLARPIDAQIEFNDRMAAIVLPELGPLLKGVESTEQPIKLRIEKQGFALPLDRFDIRRLTIPEARIDIGKVVLNNLWLTDVVQQVVRAQLPNNRTSTWFTPLELEMRNGVIRYRQRLDVLTQQSMHLSSWGTVDLGRNRLDLRIAFMTDSLRKHLGVKKARDGDTLQLPIHGSLESPKVEYQAALAGLAKIRAEAEAADKIKEKWARALIEAALEGVLKETLRASRVPNPSVDPLPWAATDQPPRKR